MAPLADALDSAALFAAAAVAAGAAVPGRAHETQTAAALAGRRGGRGAAGRLGFFVKIIRRRARARGRRRPGDEGTSTSGTTSIGCVRFFSARFCFSALR